MKGRAQVSYGGTCTALMRRTTTAWPIITYTRAHGSLAVYKMLGVICG